MITTSKKKPINPFIRKFQVLDLSKAVIFIFCFCNPSPVKSQEMNYLKYQPLSNAVFFINNEPVESKTFRDFLGQLKRLRYSRFRVDSDFGYVLSEFGVKGDLNNHQVYKIKFISDLGYQFNSISLVSPPSGRLFIHNDELVGEERFEQLKNSLTEVPKTWFCKETTDGGETGYDAEDNNGVVFRFRAVSREKQSYSSLTPKASPDDFGDITPDVPDLEVALKAKSVDLTQVELVRIDSSKTQTYFPDLRVIIIRNKNAPSSARICFVTAAKKVSDNLRTTLNLKLWLGDGADFNFDLTKHMIDQKKQMASQDIIAVAKELAYLNTGGGSDVSVLTDTTSTSLPSFPKEWRTKFENPRIHQKGNQFLIEVFTHTYRRDPEGGSTGVLSELRKHQIVFGDKINIHSMIVDSKMK